MVFVVEIGESSLGLCRGYGVGVGVTGGDTLSRCYIWGEVPLVNIVPVVRGSLVYVVQVGKVAPGLCFKHGRGMQIWPLPYT